MSGRVARIAASNPYLKAAMTCQTCIHRPDVLGQLRDGRLLGVEVKGPTGKLRPEQAVFMERIRASGGLAFVARDLRDVHRQLNQLKT